MSRARKETPDVLVRIDARTAERLDKWRQRTKRGIEGRNEAATFGLDSFLDLEEQKERQQEAWDAWVRGGKKGLPPRFD